MSLKMQADINLLQAHYTQIESRLEEAEVQLSLAHHAIHTLIGGGDVKRLKLIREDRTPTPRDRDNRKR
jgi:outer membrane protein TolC